MSQSAYSESVGTPAAESETLPQYVLLGPALATATPRQVIRASPYRRSP